MSTPLDIEVVLAHYNVITGKKVVSCPFHSDKTPSMSVDYDKNLYFCHSCSSSGDAWKLLMSMENLSFPDAKKFAEENLSFEDSGEQPQERGRFGPPRRVRAPNRASKRHRRSWRN